METPTARWPDPVDEILGGDQAVTFGYVTPAGGVVLNPLTNTGLRDRDAGVVEPVTSSIGMWKKLERIQQNPHVAVAYHTRDYGFSDRPGYVLVQGRAAVSSIEAHDWAERHPESFVRFMGRRDVGPFFEWWQRVYHRRVGVEIAVERITVWPDTACSGDAEVYGAPLPSEPPPPQAPPAKGTGPRIDHVRATKRAARLPHVLLGWVGADGFPVVVPVQVRGSEERGMVLETPEGVVPPGGRRAGLAAHWFARYTFGQTQRKHTGWLDAGPGQRRVTYAPHTESGYRFPESERVFRIVSGFGTRRGYRSGRRAGFLPG